MTDLLDLARSIALEAGELAARCRREGVEVAATKSTIVDVVTEADREVERLILGRIQDARPDDGVLGEEGASVQGSSGLAWVVDPIDGTVNYLYGLPHYAVSIAVVELPDGGGDPDPLTWTSKIGVVLNPATGELFTAEAGAGAYCGDRRLHVGEPVPLDLALIATGFAYQAATRAFQGDVVARLLPQVRDIRRQGTASLDLCFVADGRYDAYFERTLSPWDHAAGALIAREAGAAVTGMRGAAPSRDFILAAEPSVAAALEAMLDDLGEFEPLPA